MVEINRDLSAEASLNATLTGRESLQPQFRFPDIPATFGEFLERAKKSDLVDLGLELLELGVDLSEAYWSRDRLASGLKKPDSSEDNQFNLNKRPVFVLAGGLATWKGLSFFRNSAIARDLLGAGTYAPTTHYLESKGAKVIEVWDGSGVNTGDLKANLMAASEAVKEAEDSTDGPIIWLGQSLGGELAYIFAARYPDLAAKIDCFTTGGSPIPDHINSWVEGGFLFFHGRRENHPIIEEGIEFLNSREAKRMKFVSIIATRDKVLTGPAPGEVKPRESSHGALFFKGDILDEVMQIAEGQRIDKKPSLNDIYATTLPFIIAHH